MNVSVEMHIKQNISLNNFRIFIQYLQNNKKTVHIHVEIRQETRGLTDNIVQQGSTHLNQLVLEPGDSVRWAKKLGPHRNSTNKIRKYRINRLREPSGAWIPALQQIFASNMDAAEMKTLRTQAKPWTRTVRYLGVIHFRRLEYNITVIGMRYQIHNFIKNIYKWFK